MRLVVKSFIGLVCLIGNPNLMSSQDLSKDFVPLNVFEGKDKRELIETIYNRAAIEVDRYSNKYSFTATKHYDLQTEFLVRLIKNGRVLNDDSIQSIVDSIFDRIVSKNNLKRIPIQVLVLNDPNPNAISFGEGTFGVTVGLLSNIRFIDELAFISAHEVSHLELDHSMNKLIQNVDSKFNKNVKSGLKKVLSYDDDLTQEDLNKLRKTVYDNRKFSRAKEFEADSLAVFISSRAGYSLMDVDQLFSTLDSTRYLEFDLGKDLFNPLNSAKFPFQEDWTQNRSKSANKRSVLLFSEDSTKTHPDFYERSESLQRVLRQIYVNKEPVELTNHWHSIFRLQGVESAFLSRRADLTLALALEQLSLYPTNSYLASIVSKIFIDLIERKNGAFSTLLFLPTLNGEEEEQLRMVNNCLHYLNSFEMGEIAFNFLNSQSRFNPDYALEKTNGYSKTLE
jgi:Peptidase family M48